MKRRRAALRVESRATVTVGFFPLDTDVSPCGHVFGIPFPLDP